MISVYLLLDYLKCTTNAPHDKKAKGLFGMSVIHLCCRWFARGMLSVAGVLSTNREFLTGRGILSDMIKRERKNILRI